MMGRVRLLWAAGAVVVVAGVVGVLVSRMAPVAVGPADETPSPSASAVAVQTPAAPVTPGAKISPGKVVVEMVAPPVAGLSQALSDPSVPVELASVADGLALEDLKAEVFTLGRDGLHQVGSPRVVSAKVVSTDKKGTPPTVVVRVCLDRSSVRVVDGDGKDMSNPGAPARVLQIWTMASTKSGWKLVDRTFTKKLTC